jgi:hypothetical protein
MNPCTIASELVRDSKSSANARRRSRLIHSARLKCEGDPGLASPLARRAKLWQPSAVPEAGTEARKDIA